MKITAKSLMLAMATYAVITIITNLPMNSAAYVGEEKQLDLEAKLQEKQLEREAKLQEKQLEREAKLQEKLLDLNTKLQEKVKKVKEKDPILTCEEGQLREVNGEQVCTVPAQLECEEGELNVVTGQCEVDAQLECEEGELNVVTGQCEVDAQLECEDGQEPNETGQCNVGDPTCLSGTFNPVSDRCDVADPTCQPPSSYNSQTDRCERPATGGGTNCPGGFSGPENGVCHRPATCPTGSVLNPETDKCQSETVNPSCLDGTLNPATDQCEEAAEFGCENDTEPVGDLES